MLTLQSCTVHTVATELLKIKIFKLVRISNFCFSVIIIPFQALRSHKYVMTSKLDSTQLENISFLVPWLSRTRFSYIIQVSCISSVNLLICLKIPVLPKILFKVPSRGGW